jgi:hypothetical protein
MAATEIAVTLNRVIACTLSDPIRLGDDDVAVIFFWGHQGTLLLRLFVLGASPVNGASA